MHAISIWIEAAAIALQRGTSFVSSYKRMSIIAYRFMRQNTVSRLLSVIRYTIAQTGILLRRNSPNSLSLNALHFKVFMHHGIN